jgi:transcriptional regulator with XRE-family HTH domain
MIDFSELVASRVREVRLLQGWSQEKLAEEAGLSKDAVSRIERGDREPRLDTLVLIARAVGTSISRLLDFQEPVSRSSAREQQLRSLEQALGQMDPWLAKAVVSVVQTIAKAYHARSRPGRRGGRRA